MSKSRLSWLLMSTFLLILIPTLNGPRAQGENSRLEIHYQNQLLNISARNVDIKDFFSRLAEKTNITIEYPASLERQVTLDREDVSLEKFLSSFLRNMNRVFIYSGSDVENCKISEVHIYPKSRVSYPSVSAVSNRSLDRTRQRIDSYRKIIEKLRSSLSNVGEESNRGRVYINRIRRYEDRIKKLENQLY